MKKAGSSLVQLVAALSIPEQRYFRKFAERHVIGEGNQYLELFDALLQVGDAGVEGVKEQFHQANFLGNLNFNLHYLQKVLLRSLESFHYDAHPVASLRHSLSQVEVLAEKMLLPQAEKKVRQLIAKALEWEAFPVLLEALEIHRKLLKRIGGKAYWEKLPPVHAQINQALAMQMNESSLMELYDYVFTETQQTSQAQQQLDRMRLQAYLSDHRLMDQGYPKTFNARIAWHLTHAFVKVLLGQHQEALTHYRRIIQEWESNSMRREASQERYAMALIDYLNVCHRLEDYSSFEEILTTIRQLDKLPPSEVVRIQWVSYHLEVLWHLNTLRFDAAEDVVRRWEEILTQFKGKVDDASLLSFAYNICLLYFVKEDFSGALRWVNKILNFPRSPARMDIRRFAKLLNCMIHWELGNLRLLESEVPSTQRILRQEGGLNEFEKGVIAHLQRLIKALPGKEWPILKEFAVGLDQHGGSAKPPFGYQETWVWAHSRANKTSIAQQIRG